ncbi:HECT-domain (ubiquitin-transferase) [Gracilaria domingensis]|nr:HECT-domain (ubiquitin-transferase) [Gracilaria domingensis]
MNGLRRSLKSTIRFKFIDELGIDVAGIDGGGFFRKFMPDDLSIRVSPYLYGLFKATLDVRLYLNPQAPVANEDFEAEFAFLGRLLGKAVFDGVLVYIPLANFFSRTRAVQEHEVPKELRYISGGGPRFQFHRGEQRVRISQRRRVLLLYSNCLI